MVPSVKELPYEETLRALNLSSLYYRRARGDVIGLYKHIKGIYTVKNDYIKMEPPATTRGHNCKIIKPRTNKRLTQNFLVEPTGNSWNELRIDVVNVPNLNAFKNRTHKHSSQ